MNPESGRIHETIESRRKTANETAEDLLARAEALAGPELPPNWPRIAVGERVGPIKGFWFEVLEVELASQTVVMRPAERTGSRAGKPPRRRRRVRGRKR